MPTSLAVEVKRPTGLTRAASKQQIAAEKEYARQMAESRQFYERIGYPEFGGRYLPFEIPEGGTVASISETSAGLNIIFNVPTKETPAKQAQTPQPPKIFEKKPTSYVGILHELAKGIAETVTYTRAQAQAEIAKQAAMSPAELEIYRAEKAIAKQIQESKTFYQIIGYPQFGGLYQPFDVPSGYTVSAIAETPTGLTVAFEPLPAAVTEPSKPAQPTPSRGEIPPAPTAGIQLPDLGKIFFKSPIAPEETIKMIGELQRAKEDPLGFYGGKILTTVGMISILVNPPAGLISAGIGAGISEALAVGLTGQSLTPQELTQAGLQSAAFSGITTQVLKGLALIPKVGQYVYHPIGKAGIMAGIGGTSGYILSGGDTEEAAKTAFIAGTLSLGIDALTRGYGYVKGKWVSRAGADKALYQKPEGIQKTALEFDFPEEDVYKGLPSSLAEELKKMKAQQQDPLYRLLFPKDAAVQAEARWGSIRKVPEPNLADLSDDLSEDLWKFLFPEKVEEATWRAAESRWGDIREVKIPAGAKTPTGISLEGLIKWEIRAAKFEAAKLADPVGLQMLTKTGAKSIDDVMRDWSIFDLGDVPEIQPEKGLALRISKWTVKAAQFEAKKLADPVGLQMLTTTPAKSIDKLLHDWSIADVGKVSEIYPERYLSIRQQKWTIRAIKADLSYAKLLGQTIPELPKKIGEYIEPVKKAPIKIQPSDVAKEVTSAGQTLIQIQKPVLEPLVKEVAKAAVKETTTVQLNVAAVVMPKTKPKPKTTTEARTRQTAAVILDVSGLSIPAVSQKRKQRAGQAALVAELIGQAEAEALKFGVAPLVTPALSPKQKAKQEQPQETAQRLDSLLGLGQVQTQIQKQLQTEKKPVRRPRKKETKTDLWAKQQLRRIDLAKLGLAGGIPKLKTTNLASVILGKKQKRRSGKRR